MLIDQDDMYCLAAVGRGRPQSRTKDRAPQRSGQSWSATRKIAVTCRCYTQQWLLPVRLWEPCFFGLWAKLVSPRRPGKSFHSRHSLYLSNLELVLARSSAQEGPDSLTGECCSIWNSCRIIRHWVTTARLVSMRLSMSVFWKWFGGMRKCTGHWETSLSEMHHCGRASETQAHWPPCWLIKMECMPQLRIIVVICILSVALAQLLGTGKVHAGNSGLVLAKLS